MSKKKSTLVLGYTRAGHAVLLPSHQAPDMGPFERWEPGDHLDAARILTEHGEREVDPIEAWCAHWAEAHWTVGKSTKRSARDARRTAKKARARNTLVRGAAEATIRVGGMKR